MYRSTDEIEANAYFNKLKDKIPCLIPQPAKVSQLTEINRYIRKNPSQIISHICAYFGYVDYFRRHGSEILGVINAQDAAGKTPLHIAIECKRLPVVESIVQLCPEYDLVDNQLNNVLHSAAATNKNIVAAVCNAIANQNLAQEENNEHNSLHRECLDKLINASNARSLSPLYIACEKHKPDCVKELLHNGADVNGALIGDVNHPRKEYTFKPKTDHAIRQLNERQMKNGGTPLHWCDSAEHIEILLDMNCQINAKDFHGDTALHIMIRSKNLSSSVMLLSHSADVNAVGKDGETPLHLAVRTGEISIVQAVLVFGAELQVLNQAGESPRHLAATSQASCKEFLLYMLHAVGAPRCVARQPYCTEGCAQGNDYNGKCREENQSIIREVKMFDKILMESIVKDSLGRTQGRHSDTKKARKLMKLLAMDGGGIRGLIIIQILAVLEEFLGKPIVKIFDWFAGTSTGAILALLFASGKSARECREIYFRLKNKVFVGNRPYSADVLESFLKKYLGEGKLSDITATRVMVPVTVGDRFPPDIKIFRNYLGPNELIDGCKHEAEIPTPESHQEYIWKAARASSAAPTYFSPCESFLDGGLISNNPTLDLMTDVQKLNKVYEKLKMNEEMIDIGLVVSIGTGSIPCSNMEPVNFESIASLPSPSAIHNLVRNGLSLGKMLVEQACQADGAVVDRAQAWCSMIKVPYFRLNPPISKDLSLNESRDEQLVEILWETMHYLHQQMSDLQDLSILLMNK